MKETQALISRFGFGPKPSNAERRLWSPTTWEFSRELARHAIAVVFCLSIILFSDFRPPCFLIRSVWCLSFVRQFS